MARILLVGKYKFNAGPANVNRSLIENSDDDLLYLKQDLKVLRLFEFVGKVFCADIILVSGLCSKIMFPIIKLSRKPIIYLMHGCAEYENKINNMNLDLKVLQLEQEIFKYSRKIICVSSKYAEWVKVRYPQYAFKICYSNNGIQIAVRDKVDKEPYSVAVAGGNRGIKNNTEICQAVQKLNDEGIPCKLYVFGRIYKANDDFSKYSNVEIMGHLEKKEYYKKLDKICLFCANSEVEPFGLAIADALNCNCSLLCSDNVGAVSIFEGNMSDMDTIKNPHNVDEIVDKMEKLFRNGNTERLLRAVDIEAYSEKSAYIRVKSLCNEVLETGKKKHVE